MTENRPGYDAAELVRRAVARGVTVGTAESLTGGALASAIVTVSGASACFEGAVVSYSHAVKERVLGVSHELLEERGAVDPQVAVAMARGARERLGGTGPCPPPGSPGRNRTTDTPWEPSSWGSRVRVWSGWSVWISAVTGPRSGKPPWAARLTH